MFFLPFLNHFFVRQFTKDFQLAALCKPEDSLLMPKLFLQNKGLNNPIPVGRHTKKQFEGCLNYIQRLYLCVIML